MKKIIILSVIIQLLTGCLTEKQIERNCDKFAKVCTSASITEYRDTTLYLRDTLYWQLPNDTVTITDTVVYVDNFCQLQTIYKRFGLINVSAGVASSILKVNAWLTDSTILIPHIDTVFIEKAITLTTDTVSVPQKYIPGFYHFTFWFFIIACMLLILYMLWVLFFRRLSRIMNHTIQ